MYFVHVIETIITKLFSWNVNKQCSNETPGLFGYTKGFFVSTESQNSGNLHAHILLWIHGLPKSISEYENLSDVKLEELKDYEKRHIQKNMPVELRKDCVACECELSVVPLPVTAYHRPFAKYGESPVARCHNCQFDLTCSQLIDEAVAIDPQLRLKLVEYSICKTNALEFPTSEDPVAKQILAALLVEVQVHNWQHSASCNKKSQRTSDKKCCRFMIPQMLIEGRTNGNQYLNPFLLLIALLFKCNHDFKLTVRGDQGHLARYCLKYATKPQKVVEDILTAYIQAFQKSIKQHPDIQIDPENDVETTLQQRTELGRKRITTVLNSLTSKHETPSPMACLYINRSSPFWVSHKFYSLNMPLLIHMHSKDQEPVEVVLRPDHDKKLRHHSFYNDYIYRPTELHNRSLWHFMKYFQLSLSKQSDRMTLLPNHEYYATHRVVKRKHEIVLVIRGKRLPSVEDNNNYNPDDLKAILTFLKLLFIPFRTLEEIDLMNDDLVYQSKDAMNYWNNLKDYYACLRKTKANSFSMFNCRILLIKMSSTTTHY